MALPRGHQDNPIERAQARRVIDLVQEGATPEDALKQVHSPVPGLLQRADVRAVLDHLAEFSMAPEARREMVRSALNKVVIESSQGTEPVDRKLAIDAANAIAQDPEVGLRSTQGAIQINLGALGPLMDAPDREPKE